MEGGGMRCSYSAGALVAMSKKYPNFKPDILVGSSGSTGSLSYYVANQSPELERIWTRWLTSKEFLNIKRVRNIMDINYLIDTVFKKYEPLNVEKIRILNQKIFISATNTKTGRKKFFTNHDKIFEALRASKAIPILFGKKVEIDGEKYIDGSLSCPISVNIKKAIDEGATKIIVIKEENLFFHSYLINLFWRSWVIFKPKYLKRVIKNYINDYKLDYKMLKEIDGIEFHIMTPSKNYNTSAIDNSVRTMRRNFELGHLDLLTDKNIKEFINYDK